MPPREGDRYAAATAFLAKLGVDSTEVDALLASGLKWNSVGASVPPEGSALDAPALSSALESKTCFTRAEWDEFRIEDLRMDHYVKCLGEYFRPALLVGGVETNSDDRLPVPALVKKHWQQWNQTAHPDKGGDTEAYCVRKQEYTAFKMRFAEWLQAHPTGQPDFKTWCRSSMPASRGTLAEDASRRTKLKAEIKEQGEKALQAGQKALKGGQYEDAKELAAVAVRHFEQCQSQSPLPTLLKGANASVEGDCVCLYSLKFHVAHDVESELPLPGISTGSDTGTELKHIQHIPST